MEIQTDPCVADLVEIEINVDTNRPESCRSMGREINANRSVICRSTGKEIRDLSIYWVRTPRVSDLLSTDSESFRSTEYGLREFPIY